MSRVDRQGWGGQLARLTFVNIVVAIASVLTVLLGATGGWLPILGPLLFTGGWLFLGAWWLIAFLIQIRREGFSSLATLRSVAAPLLVIATLVVLFSGAPFRFGFEVSQGQLREVADKALSGEAQEDEIAGSFHVHNIQVKDGDVWMEVALTGFFDSWGFLYSPDDEPDSIDEGVFDLTRLEPRWYVWEGGIN